MIYQMLQASYKILGVAVIKLSLQYIRGGER